VASSLKKNSRSKKRKRKAVRKKKRGSRVVVWVAALLTAALLVGAGYCLGTCRRGEHPSHTKQVPVSEKRTVSAKTHAAHPRRIPKSSQNRQVPKTDAAKRYKTVKLAYRGKRPKLAIIIDDIHTKAQLDAVTSLDFPVTPSIFPPYSRAPDTPRLATQAVHYMIHLPMESGNAKYDRQSKTLKTTFTKTQIAARVHELRRLFPRAHYINNHTGSRFTENMHAMTLLYEAMRKDGFVFIDSLTTGRSMVGKVARRYGDAYVARDIFLDNKQQTDYISRQIQKAVALAKQNGYAIAIGHPYSVTFKALRSAKPLLKEVDVVYIDAIFRRY